MVINLTENNSIILHYLTQIRDKEIQKDSLRFRKNLFRKLDLQHTRQKF